LSASGDREKSRRLEVFRCCAELINLGIPFAAVESILRAAAQPSINIRETTSQ
jgi:hypothetical protein